MPTSELDQLTQLLSKLPGLGKRSARRAVLHMLQQKEQVMFPLAAMLEKVGNQIVTCENCGNLDTTSPCSVCHDAKRDHTTICVVEEVADVWAFERGSVYGGLYHVLGGTLSAMDGRGPDDLNIAGLERRVHQGDVQEVILATNATVDGQTTAHYLMDRLQGKGLKITRLAQGVPLGGELDYLDEGTLSAAMRSRQEFA